jgi:hypothetical protein
LLCNYINVGLTKKDKISELLINIDLHAKKSEKHCLISSNKSVTVSLDVRLSIRGRHTYIYYIFKEVEAWLSKGDI